MEQADKKVIANLLTCYGAYEVAKALTETANDAARFYADNAEAVIHRDAASLTHAVACMKQNHPIRQLRE